MSSIVLLFINYITMKPIVYIFLCSLLGVCLFSSFAPARTPKLNKAKIVLLLDDYVCSEDQWCYLYDYKEWVSGSEKVIFDSVFIAKGQHQVELQGDIEFTTDLKILFSHKGLEFIIPIEPDSCVVMQIGEEDGEHFYYKKALQGNLNNSYYEYWQGTIAYRNKLKKFVSENRQDSIEQLKAERFDYLISRAKNFKFSWAVHDIKIMLGVEFPDKSMETRAVLEPLVRKFPEDVSLQKV